MQAKCSSEVKYASVSVHCLEKYLTADDVREGLKIEDDKAANERIDMAVELAVKMAEARRELGVQLCMAFKQTNRETFFAEVKKRGLPEDFVTLVMGEVFGDTLQGVWDAKTKK